MGIERVEHEIAGERGRKDRRTDEDEIAGERGRKEMKKDEDETSTGGRIISE